MTKIYVDAGIDLPLERLNELNIGILYHSIIVDGEEKCSRIDLSPTEKLEYYNLVNEKVVRTSRPPLGVTKGILEDEMKNGNDIVCLTMSSCLSGMYSTCSTIANILKMEYPNRELTVVDTKASCLEYNLIVLNFIEDINKGYSMEDAINRLNEMVANKDTGLTIALASNRGLTSNGRLKNASIGYNLMKSKDGFLETVASYESYDEIMKQLRVEYNNLKETKATISVLSTCISKANIDALESFISDINYTDEIVNPNVLTTTCIGANAIGFGWIRRK